MGINATQEDIAKVNRLQAN